MKSLMLGFGGHIWKFIWIKGEEVEDFKMWI